MSKPAKSSQTLLNRLPWLAWLALVVTFLTIRWQWSMTMDDVAYGLWMPKVDDLGAAFLKEVRDYWHQGRFYPVKYLVNLLKWRLLPLDATLFHAFNAALLAGAVYLGSRAFARGGPKIALLCALVLAQRPLLDVVALNTIAEGWVALFFALALVWLPRRAVAYRVALVLAFLSKEPACVAFFATAAMHASRRRYRAAALDLGLFAAAMVVAVCAKNAGTYLGDYSLVSLQTARNLLVGLAACSVGLLPALFALAARPDATKKQLAAFTPANELRLVCLVFGAAYLVLVVARNAAGYLLIPTAFSFSLALGSLAVELAPTLSAARLVTFVLLFVACFGSALYRFERFSRGINGGSAALRELLDSDRPRLVVVNVEEAAAQAGMLAAKLGSKARVSSLNALDLDALEKGREEVAMVEFTTYNGRFTDEAISKIGARVGGWRETLDYGVYRLFRSTRGSAR